MKVVLHYQFGSQHAIYDSESVSVSRALEFMRGITEDRPAGLESANLECENEEEEKYLSSLMSEASGNIKSL